ncbi:MAG: response regulator transcription factor [Thermoguttaceae bacterium]
MSYQILLVEEAPDVRQNMKRSLVLAGFAVTEADNAKQAAELTAKKKFDLVITNLMLEHSDSGFTLCYRLKRDFPEMPVILLSSAASDMDIEFSMESASERSWIKADMLLNKPIRFEQLLYAVQRLLGCLAPAH